MRAFGRLRELLARPVPSAWLRTAGWASVVFLGTDALVQIQSTTFYLDKGTPIPWGWYVSSYVDSLIWGCFAPAIFGLVKRFPFKPGAWRLAAPVHVAAALAAGALWTGLNQSHLSVISLFFDEPTLSRALRPPLILRMLVQALFLYAQTAAVAHGFHYYREARERERNAARLESLLARAQLQVLRVQLQPHFLFNTLHAISSLMHSDLAAADRMLARLGELLRISLDRIGAQEVTLKQELEFLDRYLEIESTRFSDRLQILREVDPAVLDAMLPNLILQPLAENAVRHGVSRRAGGGRIEIGARAQDGRLLLRVRDDGPGMPEAGEISGSGVGLENCAARLRQLYGDEQHLELRNHPEGGLEVTLSLPLRIASSDAAA